MSRDSPSPPPLHNRSLAGCPYGARSKARGASAFSRLCRTIRIRASQRAMRYTQSNCEEDTSFVATRHPSQERISASFEPTCEFFGNENLLIDSIGEALQASEFDLELPRTLLTLIHALKGTCYGSPDPRRIRLSMTPFHNRSPCRVSELRRAHLPATFRAGPLEGGCDGQYCPAMPRGPDSRSEALISVGETQPTRSSPAPSIISYACPSAPVTAGAKDT